MATEAHDGLKGRKYIMKMQLAEIAQALNIEPQDGWNDITVTSVSFDSRKISAGALFVPLIGDNDGHQFVEAAKNNGAVATLWQEDHSDFPEDLPFLTVEDSLKALQQLGRYYLQKINPRVVAITGSNGKTTTKDMVASILSTQFHVKKTPENFNNEIGVPMTCLTMEPNTEVLVVELGMDRFGQLDYLSKLVSPDVAVITMIGEAHIEFFGTRDKIADAKMEITHGLTEDGYFIYNGDEPLLVSRAKDETMSQLTFGNNESNDVAATQIEGHDDSTSFKVASYPDISFSIPMLGTYNVNNALAAISVGQVFRVSPENMEKSLKNFTITKNRAEWVTGKKGEKILSDVYNSNPTAAKKVIEAFSQVPTDGKRYVVLGDMLELGDKAAQMHANLADAIDPAEISGVYLCGDLMKNLGNALQDKLSSTQIHQYDVDQKEQLYSDLDQELTANDMVMIKGSHGIALEKVLVSLIGD